VLLVRLATAVLRGTNVEHGQIRDAVTHRRQEVVGIEVLPEPEKGDFLPSVITAATTYP